MDRFEFGRLAEQKVAYELHKRGHEVAFQGYRAPFDLLVDGRLRVEVKASRWHQQRGGRRRYRYQANIRNEADVVVFCCVNGDFHFFVIPAVAVGERRHLCVRRYDPGEYEGQWSEWLGAWDVVC